MNDFWNERFGQKEYVYGTIPNVFFKSEIDKIKPAGKILLPAEGEGRNAVYAATQGWDVVAFDPSSEGRKKALALAEKNKVTIEYLLESYQTIDFAPESFDVICLCFAHMPAEMRTLWHRKLLSYLKPDGILLLEAFSEAQLGRDSGGPQNIDMLFSKEKLEHDFRSLHKITITETERMLGEGSFHRGLGALIQVVGKK